MDYAQYNFLERLVAQKALPVGLVKMYCETKKEKV